MVYREYDGGHRSRDAVLRHIPPYGRRRIKAQR